jgi:hypothetical protein
MVGEGGSREEVGEVCLRHFMRERINLREVYGEGYGNCLECISDNKNKQCKGYITFYLPTRKDSSQPAH